MTRILLGDWQRSPCQSQLHAQTLDRVVLVATIAEVAVAVAAQAQELGEALWQALVQALLQALVQALVQA